MADKTNAIIVILEPMANAEALAGAIQFMKGVISAVKYVPQEDMAATRIRVRDELLKTLFGGQL